MSDKNVDQKPETESKVDAVTVSTEEASSNFYWTFGKEEVFNLQTTIRAAMTEEQMKAHIESVKSMLKLVVAVGGHAKQIGNGYVKTEAAPASGEKKPVAPGGPGKPKSPAAPGGASGASAWNGSQSLVVVRMEVKPSTDGSNKVTVNFYKQGDKWPAIYATKTIDKWCEVLAQTGAWGAEHFDSPTNYDVNYKITWHNSDKLNSKGNPYKDIDEIVLV